MKIYLKSDNEWLYTDEDKIGTEVYNSQTIEVSASLNTECGIQFLVTDANDKVTVTDISDDLKSQINILRAVTVNFNTAEEMEGFEKNPFVYENTPEPLPEHITRKAPFDVYDAFKPYDGEAPIDGKIAFYVTVNTEDKAGDFQKRFIVKSGDEETEIKVLVKVYNVALPEKRKLKLTNWFSISNMAFFHNIEEYSSEHFQMIEKYADVMKSMHQTHFLMLAEHIKIDNVNGEYTFDLSLLEKISKIFMDKGFEFLEFGPVGTRKRVYYEDLCVLGIDGLISDSFEGKKALENFFKAMADMAFKNGWQDKIIFHIADEPDEPESAIPRRMEQYRTIYDIMHKFLPDSKVCEAVKTAIFKDYIDVLVPLSKTYEDSADEFLKAKEKGKEVWFYTCCVPTGNYYQRFIDVPLLSGRYLFWSASRFNMSGYLHWGLNMMEREQHPFKQTNQYHTYGDGVCLPTGDSHILYPDGDKLYRSMRMVNLCRGTDDFELLEILKLKDKEAYNGIVGSIVDSFHGKTDITLFNNTYKEMLEKF